MSAKKLISLHDAGSHHWVGDGFPVRNFFPSTGLETEVSPFLMLDYAGPTDFKPTEKPRGVGEHPHRGFETVTIAYQGSVDHRDSGGNKGTIFPGDVQWMTAGSGIVHEEMHEKEFAHNGGTFEMVQLWVNLPRVHKMTEPKYQALISKDIPQVRLDGDDSFARVIGGTFNGVTGPASTFSPVTLLDVRLAAGTRTSVKLEAGHNVVIFILSGSLQIAGREVSNAPKLALLDTQGDEIELVARDASKLLIMSGQPIDEPIASYGPFVMNTKEELMTAIQDYQTGKMGHLSAV
ncbi:MAG TPA: pirin family protein [Planktothrix sp.]|jgi:hypothetical protein